MELRDRIAAVIHKTETPLHDHGQALAQAVIDDLGLVVEERCAQEPTPVRRFGRTEWDNREVTLHRIVGRWEVER